MKANPLFLSGVLIAVTMLSLPAQESSKEKSAANPQQPSREDRLARFLKQFPESDADKDGKLTREEVQTFNQKRRQPGDRSRNRGRPAATVADVKYGEHEKQAFDLWPVPDSEMPTPLAIFIHGGGFRGGDKRAFSPGALALFHEAGIAFCSMNYRLSDVGPYPVMMGDAARGLQTIRHRATEWNIDPGKIACFGGSAGAGISLWLAFHDDLADPESEDPIARQSTRILAAATSNGQSTYDMRTFREWFNAPGLEPHAALLPFFGVTSKDDWNSDRVKKLMNEASPITHLSRDDKASVYMAYNRPNTPVDASTDPSTWVHHVRLGLKLQEAMKELGLECIVRAPDMKPETDPYGTVERFIAAKLRE